MLNMIVAMDSKGGIGIGNDLPWKLQQDMRLFRDVTKGTTVCMGHKTWDSIPARSRPLPDRMNVVLTTKGLDSLGAPNITSVVDVEDIMEVLALAQTQEVWIIGGANVYKQFFGYLDYAVVTHILDQDYNCDTLLQLPDKLAPIWSKEVSNVLETKSCIDVNLRYTVYKATKNDTGPIRRYERGLIERVQQSLQGWKADTQAVAKSS